jgi:hypothetical protein
LLADIGRGEPFPMAFFLQFAVAAFGEQEKPDEIRPNPPA